ncbi:MAG: ATP-binding protein [Acidobacteriota bacterium]
MTPFRDLPIKQKLMVLNIGIAAAALLLSGFLLVVIDAVLFHQSLRSDLGTFARVIADNSTASLAFDDPQSAGEILGALHARTHVISACLAREDGSMFADFTRPGSNRRCEKPPPADEIHSTWDAVIVTRGVVLKGRKIGSLTIAYDNGELTERIRIWGAAVLAVLALSCLVVVWFSARLRSIFLTPIVELARTTAAVSATKVYSVRAASTSGDEVGQLAGAFNEMLAGIESRDADLRTTLLEREQALARLAEVNWEFQRSNEQLARSNEDLERFAFIASHDMQEPLRMVTIYSQLLVKQCGEANAETANYRDYIISGTARMRDLIADLRSYLDITTAPREMGPVDVNGAILKAKESLRAAIEESGADVISGPMPVVNGLESHIVSLFQNLIGNAIKYRSDQPPRIRISAAVVDGMNCFEVSDNGIGIAPEFHSQVFQAFRRLHGREIDGTGIGLAICQRIVERKGGRIWVESQVGQGATFKFALPRLHSEDV